ncbi:hypothetical protein J5N97_027673 [Dioscorea zingiberensis]|uniref:Cation/H(+) antiporter C-terminal domain-containing protein n=1 Tax=Dioscorea zingiberensis TaxID=325984 RepID=A0A9D5H468_9LILI|nr:hypothetical protein J5N97_027673 [Dioscorea zingiberensis]
MAEMKHYVDILFFDSTDDREALALAFRIATHPCVSITVVGFLPLLIMKKEDTGINEENNTSPGVEGGHGQHAKSSDGVGEGVHEDEERVRENGR